MKKMQVNQLFNSKNKPQKIEFSQEVFKLTEEYAPICFLYQNINDKDNFLFRDYSITLEDSVLIGKTREVKKVRCIETNKVFRSPALAGRYYGFKDGDMVAKVCRHERETAKGLHFEYLEKGEK